MIIRCVFLALLVACFGVMTAARAYDATEATLRVSSEFKTM